MEICFYGDSRTGFVDCTPSPKQNESLIVLINLQQLNQRPNQSSQKSNVARFTQVFSSQIFCGFLLFPETIKFETR